MTSLGKWSTEEQSELTRSFHHEVRALVARRLEEMGGKASEHVFARQFDLLSKEDLAEIERTVLATGYRFQPSAQVSVREAPDKYQPLPESLEAAGAVGEAGDDGRVVVAEGDNVFTAAAAVTGRVRLVRTIEDVAELMDGVPEGTIALIDDSGGTLTAPILGDFVAILCCGGTTRSHLGILSREYGIPCLMGVELRGLADGDTVEVEFTAPARTAEHYEHGGGTRAKVWKVS